MMMDGLITGTIFVTVWLLCIKIREMIDRLLARRRQKRSDSTVPRYGPSYHEGRALVRERHQITQPIPTKVEMIPLPPQEEMTIWGASLEDVRLALIALGRAMSSPSINVTLKDDPKPPLTQEWPDQTDEEIDEAWDRVCSKKQQYIDQTIITH